MAAIWECTRMFAFVTFLTSGLTLAAFTGCDNRPLAEERPTTEVDVDVDRPLLERNADRPEVDVQAPGVDVGVNRDGDRDVEVRTPLGDVHIDR